MTQLLPIMVAPLAQPAPPMPRQPTPQASLQRISRNLFGSPGRGEIDQELREEQKQKLNEVKLRYNIDIRGIAEIERLQELRQQQRERERAQQRERERRQREMCNQQQQQQSAIGSEISSNRHSQINGSCNGHRVIVRKDDSRREQQQREQQREQQSPSKLSPYARPAGVKANFPVRKASSKGNSKVPKPSNNNNNHNNNNNNNNNNLNVNGAGATEKEGLEQRQ